MSSVWFGFFVPTGVPDAVKKVLVPALEKSIKSADLINAVHQLGAVKDYKPTEEFKKSMVGEYGMVKELLKAAGPPEK